MSGKAVYGERWQTDLARDLGLSDGRRLRQWLSGDRPLPNDLWMSIGKILEGRKVVIDEALNEIDIFLNANE